MVLPGHLVSVFSAGTAFGYFVNHRWAVPVECLCSCRQSGEARLKEPPQTSSGVWIVLQVVFLSLLIVATLVAGVLLKFAGGAVYWQQGARAEVPRPRERGRLVDGTVGS